MHPVLFELFGYPVHLYAVMIALGFVIGIWMAVRYGERVGFDRDLILDLCWWILVSGLVGSRIVFMIVNWEQYYYPCADYEYFNQLFPDRAITEPDCTRLLRFWNGGLVFYGGVIGDFDHDLVFTPGRAQSDAHGRCLNPIPCDWAVLRSTRVSRSWMLLG